MVNGSIRSKSSRSALKLWKSTIAELIGYGLISFAKDGRIIITGKGAAMMSERRVQRASQRRHYRDRVNNGWKQRNIWVHESETEKLEEFIRCHLTRP